MLKDNRIDGELLDALSSFSSIPSTPCVLQCLRDESVQEAAVRVAEKMRHIAIEEDQRRIEANKKAKEKRTLINYRQFYVGGVGIGIVPSKRGIQKYDWWVFPAYNTKPHQNVDKFCAEMRIMRAAREVRCQCIGGLVVIGERQHDKRSGVSREWGLDPCEACRDCMRMKKDVFRKKTLVLTAQPLAPPLLRHIETLPELMAAHKETWP